MVYSPDYWQVVKISSLEREKPIYKVFATWTGGYIRGDEWRLNSGITEVKTEGDLILFEGSSGSRYVCRNDEHAYRTSGYSGSVLGDYIEKVKELGATMEVLPFNTNWKELDYEY